MSLAESDRKTSWQVPESRNRVQSHTDSSILLTTDLTELTNENIESKISRFNSNADRAEELH